MRGILELNQDASWNKTIDKRTNVPIMIIRHKKNVGFITNIDGTISIIIKNINHTTSK